MSAGKNPLPAENRTALMQRLQQMAENLKACCEERMKTIAQ
jgi:hypothetical protein